jgi:hypothetical protein
MAEDYRDNMTLEEIADNDLEMIKDAVKNCKRYRFNSPNAAKQLHFVAVDATLKYIGLDVMLNPSEGRVQKSMDRLGVRIEDRQNYKGEASWRNGLYIYKKGELVAFISSIVHDKPSPFAINRKEHWLVYTNAKLDDRYVSGKISRRGFGARVVSPGSRN